VIVEVRALYDNIPCPTPDERSSSAEPLHLTDAALQTNIFGLHCGMWVIDCASCQAYNVCVIMAPCERWPQGGAEERIACPRGEGEAPAMGIIKRGCVMPTATGYKRALST
jgi:hypothetical protein